MFRAANPTLAIALSSSPLDLHLNNDFRSTYSTILDKWLGLDPGPIVKGQFEQFDFISS